MKTIIIDGVEYNLTPKVAFCEGDWVVSPNGVYWHIDAIQDGRYQVSSDSGKHTDWPLDTNIYHKFTMQDAKPGDVLSDGTTIFIFKDLLSDGSVMSYCDYDADSDESDAFCSLSMNLMCSKITPATKVQRNILFGGMADAGYTFDFEKKELKKIEQKPAWTEDDERIILAISQLLKDCESENGWNRVYSNDREVFFADMENWLKFLKDRVGCEVNCTTTKEWKPSDEQMQVLLSEVTAWTKGCPKQIVLESLYNDLKRLLKI